MISFSQNERAKAAEIAEITEDWRQKTLDADARKQAHEASEEAWFKQRGLERRDDGKGCKGGSQRKSFAQKEVCLYSVIYIVIVYVIAD